MIFRQLLEPVSSTYTYLLGCPETGQAVLVDPVVNSMDRDLQVLQALGLRLAFTTKPWRIRRMTTRAATSPPSRRRRAATRAWVAASRWRSSSRSWRR